MIFAVATIESMALCSASAAGLEREADQRPPVNANDVESIEEISSVSNPIDLDSFGMRQARPPNIALFGISGRALKTRHFRIP